jgi:branched-chain amino acid transport system permease protein
MVYGILRLINFAHGDVYMLGAFMGLFASRWFRAAEDPSPIKAMLVLLTSMALCAVIGMVIERLAYKPVRKSPRLSALITAIGVSLLLENGGVLLFGASPRFFPQIVEARNIPLGMGVTLSNQQLIVLVVSFGLMFALRWLVLFTKVGKAMQAVSHNHMAASLMGISVDRIITFTFMIGSALAAAAGVLVALQSPKIEPYMGILPGLKAFVAAVLGGIGNIPGAVVGGLVMGVAEVLVTGYLSPTYRDAIAFILLIVILLVRPAGIFGKAVAEKV